MGSEETSRPSVTSRVLSILAVFEKSLSVGVNSFASNHFAPFGGRHDSGLGVEYGLEGLAAYLTYQSVHRR